MNICKLWRWGVLSCLPILVLVCSGVYAEDPDANIYNVGFRWGEFSTKQVLLTIIINNSNRPVYVASALHLVLGKEEAWQWPEKDSKRPFYAVYVTYTFPLMVAAKLKPTEAAKEPITIGPHQTVPLNFAVDEDAVKVAELRGSALNKRPVVAVVPATATLEA